MSKASFTCAPDNALAWWVHIPQDMEIMVNKSSIKDMDNVELYKKWLRPGFYRYVQ
jgi:hypothetical protein